MSADYDLAYGTHSTPEEGRCAMEWVSYLAGEPHGDRPACVSPVLRAFCTALNDGLDHAPRQRLRLYLARTIGTAGDGLDEPRAWEAMDWLIRTYTPAWLLLAGQSSAADGLRSLLVVSGADDLAPALEALRLARQRARDEWATASAWLPSGLAARAAAREMAWATAAAAAWAAARIGVGDIAGDRARAAARAAAGDAAATVARAARASAGRTVARDAARAALAPTLEQLQESAFALLDRMLPTVSLTQPDAVNANELHSHAGMPT
jgi:hypothetical protein